MLLTFTKHKFEQLIKDGVKVHTIRADKGNRWKVGTKIHFWLGNPRNTRGKNKPYQFGVGEVSRVEILIKITACPEEWQNDVVYIGEDAVLKADEELNALAINDGFESWAEMREFFPTHFVGKIIFWKNCQWFGENSYNTMNIENTEFYPDQELVSLEEFNYNHIKNKLL